MTPKERAQLVTTVLMGYLDLDWGRQLLTIRRIADAISEAVAEEREACAALAESFRIGFYDEEGNPEPGVSFLYDSRKIAAAIRARHES